VTTVALPIDGIERAHGVDAVVEDVVWQTAFEALPGAALILDGAGRLLAANAAARVLLGAVAVPAARCCVLLGCRPPGTAHAAGCVTDQVFSPDGSLAERQIQLDDGGAAWVSAVRSGDDQVVVMLHRLAGPAGLPVGDLPPRLTVRVLGRTQLDGDAEGVGGEWLSHRPGQVLKYLVCQRGRVVTLEELLEVFWPRAGRSGAASVRQAIHTLRDRLEPGRPKGKPSGYVIARTGGYELAPGRVSIDADDFEARARSGLDALQRAAAGRAETALTAAALAYGGEFLADEPYAEWALAERERLRDLAGQVLRGLVGLKQAAGDEQSAAEHLQRLAELEPFDLQAQRDLIALLLRRGRHSEALRRYELVRRRYKRAFGTDPDFTLDGVLRGSS
jgi:DNA-binding SARP family transcriptional activator